MLDLKERYLSILECVHCGLCISACPTYQIFKTEMDSPRGRLHIARAIADGRIGFVPGAVKHLDLCLDCRACFSECPASVKYPYVIEAVKVEMARSGAFGIWRRLISFFIDRAISSPQILSSAVRILKAMRALHIFSIADRMKLWRPWNPFAMMELMIPEDATPSPGIFGSFRPNDPGKPALRVGFFKGCVMESVYSHVNISTIELLVRAGCEVVVPEDQVCCGAPSLHLGFPERAEEMARRNLAAFEDIGVDLIVTNCAGCGAMMKDYGETFGGRFHGFSRKVRDICELLAELLPSGGVMGELQGGPRVTYHDPCHLAHAQGIREQPRALIRAVEGVDFVEMSSSDRCCGGAGAYGILHPSVSLELLSRKIEDIEDTGASYIVTANPGCMMQMEMGIRIRNIEGKKVLHIVEFLKMAQGGRKEVRGIWR
jgi:glycolate oxidase iron-sulfur subunit